MLTAPFTKYYKKYPEDIDAVHGLAFHIKSKGGLQVGTGGSELDFPFNYLLIS